MKFTETEIPGVWIIEPKVFADSRGYFMESFKQQAFEEHVGPVRFIQENESCSTKGVLRGMHYQQEPYAQSKLVRVISGSVLDVAVDIRKGSPTYGRYIAVELTHENKLQLFIPQGFAHGFCVLSEQAIFTYKVDNPYMPAYEASLRFDDPTIGINWGTLEYTALLLSEKDKAAPFLAEATNNFLYK